MGFYSTNPVYSGAALGGKLILTGGELVVQDVDLVQLSDGGGSLGNATDDRFANIYATSSFNATAAMAIGATVSTTKGLFLVNTTAAALGAQQASPSLILGGKTWDTDGSSKAQNWRFHMLGVQAADPETDLILSSDSGSGTYYSWMTLKWAEAMGASLNFNRNVAILWDNDATASIGASASGRPDTVYAFSGLTQNAALALGATPSTSKGVILVSSTAAAAGAQQASPSIILGGSTHDGTSTSFAQTFRWHTLGTQAAAPVASLILGCDYGDAAYDNLATWSWNNTIGALTFNQDMDLKWTTDDVSDIGTVTASAPSGIYAGSNFTLSRAFALTNTVSATKGVFLVSTTAATGGATIQHSPPLVLSGSTWDSDGSAKTTKWSILSGGNSDTAPTAHLRFYGDNEDGTGANSIASFYWTGSQGGLILQHPVSHLLWNTDNAGSIGSATANRPLDVHIARAWHIYGDSGGTANSISLANATSTGAVTCTLGTNAPADVGTTTPNTWIKIYIGTTAYFFPVWT